MGKNLKAHLVQHRKKYIITVSFVAIVLLGWLSPTTNYYPSDPIVVPLPQGIENPRESLAQVISLVFSRGGDLTTQEINGYYYTPDDLEKVELIGGKKAGYSGDRGTYIEYFVSVQVVTDGKEVDNDKWFTLVEVVVNLAEQAVEKVSSNEETD